MNGNGLKGSPEFLQHSIWNNLVSSTVASNDNASNDEKRKIHKCDFPACDKIYTKSSHLKAHKRWLEVKVFQVCSLKYNKNCSWVVCVGFSTATSEIRRESYLLFQLCSSQGFRQWRFLLAGASKNHFGFWQANQKLFSYNFFEFGKSMYIFTFESASSSVSNK